MKKELEKLLYFMEKIDNKVSEGFKMVGLFIGCIIGLKPETPVNVIEPIEVQKSNHDYIIDYMTACSQKEIDVASKMISEHYPFK